MIEDRNKIESKKKRIDKYDTIYAEKGELIKQEFF